tara:strand:- start:2215 stop:3066 length:852 start_codon:yes stop_codon:yes gene_type:complete
MTAFSRYALEAETGRYTWEIRSVNHRYAEVFIRMPEEFRALESDLRARLVQRVNRGKIDCNLRIEQNAGGGDLVVNDANARAVVEALRELGRISGNDNPPDPLELLRWPGILETRTRDAEQMSRDICTAFDEALTVLIDTREREGGKLKGMVAARCDGIEEQIANLRSRIPEIIALMHERYTQRLKEYVQDLDKVRVEQECALLLQKLDVAEELDRLEAHLQEVRRVLAKGSPAGRRLDFLMQELNREANTIGSKSAHIDSSSASVELKVLIEQMREQIQNIE